MHVCCIFEESIMKSYTVIADPKLSFSEIIVPTNDSVRNTYMLDTLLSNDKHVLMVGATGRRIFSHFHTLP